MQNAGYLFAAYSVIWAVVFGYVFFLLRKQAALKRRMEAIKEELNEKRGG